ncbi:MAG: hypothetical protein WAR24_11015 [Candidatus Acidiferrales bacterium]
MVTSLKTGSQLFFTATSGKQWIDFSTSSTPPFPFNLTKTDSITGGTGEFAGATGTLVTEGSGAILSIDKSHHVFGWVQIKYEAKIKLPEEDHLTSKSLRRHYPDFLAAPTWMNPGDSFLLVLSAPPG